MKAARIHNRLFGLTQVDPPGVVDGVLVDPQAYFWWLIERAPGQPAPDWVGVLTFSGIPPGFPPYQKPYDNGFYGLTQQTGADGVRGRLFLPTAVPDSLGYYSHPIDLLNNSGGDCSQNPAHCVWAWKDEIGGPPYVPLGQSAPIPPPDTGTPSSGVTEEKVQEMIDASMVNAVKLGDKIALRTSGDQVLGTTAEVNENDQPVKWKAAQNVSAWESFKVEKGQ